MMFILYAEQNKALLFQNSKNWQTFCLSVMKRKLRPSHPIKPRLRVS